MLGASEFLGQVLPLFIQIIGLPLVVVGGYYAYRNIYLPRKNKTTTIETSIKNDLPPLDMLTETSNSVAMEDDLMSEQNQSIPDNKKTSSRSKIDTGDLPPLDMLLGKLEDEPSPPATPAPDEPAQIVQLRELSQETAYVQLNTGQIAPAQEIVTILRDNDDGKLIIQVGGSAYRTLANTSDVKQFFTQIMKELAGTITQQDTPPETRHRYVVGKAEATSKPATVTPQKSKSPVSTASATPSIRDLLIDDSAVETATSDADDSPKVISSSPPPPPAPDGTMPGDLPSYKLDDNPLKAEKKGRFGNQKIEAETPPELDLAAAIETYLQYKLQHTPDYLGRKIHIHGTPTGTIRIQVDEDYYDFVDEVTDAEVRSFLQATIAEWQERQ